MPRVYINDVKTEDSIFTISGKDQANLLNEKFESFSHFDKQNFITCNTKTNSLIMALHISFAKHIPLKLSPDMIFNTILQSISTYVSLNSELVRDIFVTHENKKTISIRNDELIKGINC